MSTTEVAKTKKTYPATCDIYETEGKVILSMEMPGVSKEGLDIRVDDDKLIINGHKKLPQVEGSYKLREIRLGDYHHQFTLDDTIDRNKIEASVKNGVVTLTLAIKEAVKPRKISIKTH